MAPASRTCSSWCGTRARPVTAFKSYPLLFQREKIGQAAAHVSVVDKVGCYGMAVRMWEMLRRGRILAQITLRFCTPGKGSVKLEDSREQGEKSRKV